MGRHRDNRKPSLAHPMVYRYGWLWLRSGYPSRYDGWPVTNEYQPAHQITLSQTRPRR